jgi:hypothetical protein
MSAPTNHGGSAFPYGGNHHTGMTLRDWFAGQAIHGLLHQAHVFEIREDGWIAKRAYETAGAMLAEREKGGDDA